MLFVELYGYTTQLIEADDGEMIALHVYSFPNGLYGNQMVV